MSDRIAVMNKGRYEQLAGPETLYERPTTRFVASFVGASNLLEGKIGSDGDSWTITLPSGDVVRAPKSLGEIGTGGAIGVCVPRSSRCWSLGKSRRGIASMARLLIRVTSVC